MTELDWTNPFVVGLLPMFFNEHDDRPALDQLQASYPSRPFDGFEMVDDELVYPGDPPMRPISSTWLKDERLVLYECELLAIIQKDGSFTVTRVD